MGDPITGREFLIGLKKASEWGTAVACGAGDGLLIKSESLKATIEHLQDDSLGLPFIQRTDPGNIAVAGSIEAYLRYEGLDVAIALAMGTAGTPDDAGNGAYSNEYVMADDLIGLFATIAKKMKSDKVHEFPSVKIHGFKISAEMNAPVIITLDCIANILELASVTNTTTTMGNLTYPDKGNRIIMNTSTTVRINDEDGAALDADDKIYPSGFELTFSRPVEGDQLGSASGVNEPAPSGIPEPPELVMHFPRYDDTNHQYFVDWDAFTRKKMDISFQGALIGGANYYGFTINFPNLKVKDPEALVSSPGKIPATVPFICLGTDSAPTGMTGITKPFQLNIMNTRSTDPLA